MRHYHPPPSIPSRHTNGGMVTHIQCTIKICNGFGPGNHIVKYFFVITVECSDCKIYSDCPLVTYNNLMKLDQSSLFNAVCGIATKSSSPMVFPKVTYFYFFTYKWSLPQNIYKVGVVFVLAENMHLSHAGPCRLARIWNSLALSISTQNIH